MVEDTVHGVYVYMSMSRESPPPHTHSKHSTLEKVRGHIVSIRRDPV